LSEDLEGLSVNGFLGEFLGTMILILLGDGVVAGVVLSRTKSQNAGWIVITAGWAFAVMCGVFTAVAYGGTGEINPVGPFTDMITGSRPIGESLGLMAGEFLGAFTGAVLVWVHYLPHWPETNDPGAKLAVFCTSPAIWSPARNLVSEIIGTFVLGLVAIAIGRAAAGKGLEPFLIGSLVWGIGLGLGGTTGYAINPARDLGPRIAHAVLPIVGKGGSGWDYAWIPVAGPLIGGTVAVLLVKVLG
jgi:glycerol uptake facilitator protein